MRSKIVMFLIMAIGCAGFAFGQKVDPRPKTPTINIPADADGVPQIKNFAYLIDIDRDSNIHLSVQKSEEENFLTNTADTKPLTDFLTAVSSVAGNKVISRPDPIIIVRADPELSMGTISDVILKSRNSARMKVKLEAGIGEYIVVPAEPKLNSFPKPNPLILVVSIDKNSSLKLNQEEQGTLKDLRTLENKLKEVFQDREAAGVFREGTNEVETTVYIKPDRSILFKDVILLTDTLREAGSKMIELQVDGNMEPKVSSILEKP